MFKRNVDQFSACYVTMPHQHLQQLLQNWETILHEGQWNEYAC